MGSEQLRQPSKSTTVITPAIGGLLQRKCACGQHIGGGGECAKCRKKHEGALQRAAVNAAPVSEVPPIVHEVLRSPGQPLDPATRAFMEPRFGHDFSRVRVHTDAQAAESARAVNALAYTVGHDIFFAHSHYDPASSVGRWILAHELAHIIQQVNGSFVAGQEIELGAPDRCEQQADAAATAVQSGSCRVPLAARPGVAAMRLTPDEFRKALGTTKDQKSAISALFANKGFLSLWDYMKACPATPKRDLGPLRLEVEPGLGLPDVERFGGYFPVPRMLKINPTKPEHKSNPAELVDTITHELIHAVDDLQADCMKAGAKAAPLTGAATVFPPTRAEAAAAGGEEKLMKELGPGASNPCEEFLDINKAAQQMIIQILKSNIKVAKVGRPTVTFVNEILRRDPKAMATYIKCRDVACATSDPDARSKAVAACSADIIAKFMPKDLKP